MAARNKGRRGGATRGSSTGSRSWGDRWRSKSLVGHARTHPYATAMAATAAGAGALLWARRGAMSRHENISAMAI